MDKIITINVIHILYTIYSFEIIKPQIVSMICCIMLVHLNNSSTGAKSNFITKILMGIIHSVLGPIALPFILLLTIMENCNVFFKY